MSSLQRGAHLVLPIGLMACLLVVLVPLPPGVTDVLIAINLGASALILITTVSVKTPLEFSVFPTLLLATTVGRLVLNIATTRLILSSADAAGLDAAGGIIRGFGQFVAGDQLSVGIIIFSILVVVQFVVITKGAARISEVAARFALDGMPGRQMSIDADLNAGVIDQSEARQQRENLVRQADFYGAMDGASKFVRGDAIVGVLIISVNIAGGLYMGLFESGMTLQQSLDTYIKLTIGDGLVSQLPALLISVAAGILVSRGSRRTNLGMDFLEQLLRNPEPLVVAGGFLSLLVFANLPALPLLLVGGACMALAFAFRAGRPWSAQSERASVTPEAHKSTPPTTGVEQFLGVDPLELELGVALLRLADPARGGDLLDRISTLRNQTAAEIGVVLPKVRIRDNLSLTENAFRIRLYGDEVASEYCYPLRTIVSGPDVNQLVTEGIEVTEPMTGGKAIWMDPAEAKRLPALDLKTQTAAEFIISTLRRITRVYADGLLTRDAVKLLLERTRESAPAVVDEILGGELTLADLQQILKCLVAAGLSIRNLPLVLETVCDSLRAAPTVEGRVEFVRGRLARSIVTQFTSRDGSIAAITLAREIEDWLEMHAADQSDVHAASMKQIIDNLISQSWHHPVDGALPVVVVSRPIRQSLQKHLRGRCCNLVVLGRQEVERFARVREVSQVSWSSLQTTN